MNTLKHTQIINPTVPLIRVEDFSSSPLINKITDGNFSELADTTTYGFEFKVDYKVGTEGQCHEISPKNDAQQIKRNMVIELLGLWQSGDTEEQTEAWEFIKENLDKDRLSKRELFPEK